jgi:hypothetical protein
MLEELRRQMERWDRERALSALSHVEEVLRDLADLEDLFGVLTLACEDPSLRQIVAGRFKFLEACMAALAAAAGCVPPEPAEVGK